MFSVGACACFGIVTNGESHHLRDSEEFMRKIVNQFEQYSFLFVFLTTKK